MKIGIDCRHISSPTELGRYTRHFIHFLSQTVSSHEWLLFCYEGDKFVLNTLPQNSTLISLGGNENLVSDHIFFNAKIKENAPDFMYFIGMNVPVGVSVPFGVYINDLTQMAYPPKTMFNPFLKAFQSHQISSISKKARYVFVSLPSLIRDAIEFLGVSEEKLLLNTPGFSALIPQAKDSLSMEREMTKAKQKYQIPKDYLLVIGNVDERNNVTRLISIVKDLQKQGQDLDLVIYGQENASFYAFRNELIQLGMQQRVHILPTLEPEEIPYIIGGSKCIVHSAFYEGFCELLLQAVSQEKAIVASNIISLRELLGENGFISFYPASAPSIQKAILQALQEPQTAENTIKNAQKMLPSYTWERHFQTFLETVQK